MIWLVYSLVGIYANMAEMPGVRQIDRSCQNFHKNWKTILENKMNFWEINWIKLDFYYLFYILKM